ncbi:MAG: hypothetical protein ACRENK_16995 [Gemmatimonadaceae bacterium]
MTDHDYDDEPMRTLCPVCGCWVDDCESSSVLIDGVRYHAGCPTADETAEGDGMSRSPREVAASVLKGNWRSPTASQ